jgi:hypothetical protein
MRQVSVNTFDSVLLLNRGDSFELRSLPAAAQFAPVFGIAVGDFDGDGAEDVVLAQNFFGVNPAESRLDAGCGLLLKGDGRGNLQPIPAADSGIVMYGEGRAAAVSDFDHDGRLDLVVTQSRGTTRLFHNESAIPGLRVQITGLPGNLQAVGTQIRGRIAGRPAGPVHEIHAGAGYWSQDSGTLIMAGPQPWEAIDILWPEGLHETVQVPPGSKIISLKQTPTEGP